MVCAKDPPSELESEVHKLIGFLFSFLLPSLLLILPPPFPPGTNYNLENHGIGQPNKTIASSSLRLLSFSAYLELSHHSIENTAAGNQQLQLALNDSTNSEKIDFKHIFVEITGESIYGGANPVNSSADYSQLEDVDIKVIWDKFSQNKNGLRDLYDKGAYVLVDSFGRFFR